MEGAAVAIVAVTVSSLACLFAAGKKSSLRGIPGLDFRASCVALQSWIDNMIQQFVTSMPVHRAELLEIILKLHMQCSRSIASMPHRSYQH
eukprot:s2771_g6.t1